MIPLHNNDKDGNDHDAQQAQTPSGESDRRPIRKKRKQQLSDDEEIRSNKQFQIHQLSETEIYILERVVELTPAAIDHMRAFHSICSSYDNEMISDYIQRCCSQDCRLSVISITSSVLFPLDHVYWEIRGNQSIESFLSTFFGNVPDGSSRCINVRVSNYIRSDSSFVVSCELSYLGTKTYETEVIDRLHISKNNNTITTPSRPAWSSEDCFILGGCASNSSDSYCLRGFSYPCNSFSSDADDDTTLQNDTSSVSATKLSTTTYVLDDLSSFTSTEYAKFQRGNIIRPPCPFELSGKLELLIDRESIVRGIKFCFI